MRKEPVRTGRVNSSAESGCRDLLTHPAMLGERATAALLVELAGVATTFLAKARVGGHLERNIGLPELRLLVLGVARIRIQQVRATVVLQAQSACPRALRAGARVGLALVVHPTRANLMLLLAALLVLLVMAALARVMRLNSATVLR